MILYEARLRPNPIHSHASSLHHRPFFLLSELPVNAGLQPPRRRAERHLKRLRSIQIIRLGIAKSPRSRPRQPRHRRL